MLFVTHCEVGSLIRFFNLTSTGNNELYEVFSAYHNYNISHYVAALLTKIDMLTTLR